MAWPPLRRRVARRVAGREVKETVEILGTDKYKKAIAFRGADGKFREISMDAPHLEGRLERFQRG